MRGPEIDDDIEAFRRYVATDIARLRWIAYRICRDWHTAEDAVSTTLARMYANWSEVVDPRKYATRAVTNAITDELRRAWRREQPVTTACWATAPRRSPTTVSSTPSGSG